ncbi:MAG: septal ring lytic transglycosylase RlpA family protein [gamma proteobacterium symbiont of Bathyaustriella thionipta]|nr:septal ring lytic transglycosylase RlpA family protein [gamma proteobacterium symbiont of Bathyaustriella thionipta]MCU7948609.1 septal ring lytic transglycosylase RlpA family protein [gamma proteobacterium symbiont of Bathyaustriella thionipta]MCU7952886.1 septal ring lytic transglycosylase RlpA family protein [gamma proteobacterium symbiont of Bathyaustriella thionipta]MCU7955140.1 septal ring lytic transglycosylase RlpA family protein [gamma proteobacterium symbiont of Bathyaustriella thio
MTILFDNQATRTLLITSMLAFALISCGGSGISSHDGPPSRQVDVSNIPDAVPQQTQRSKYGNPKSYVVFGKRYYVMPSANNYKERGIASWYGSKFHGKRTSSGEPYDMHAMTAAHKTLPLPTYVRVTNLKNGRQVILKVNDRGPFHDNRVIDLSHTAAVKLGIKGTGTGLVEVEAITPGQSDTSSAATTPSYPASNTPATVGLYLQLGAFVSSQNAYQLKDKVNLALSASQAHISKTLRDGQQFYRVRIGPFTNTEQADNLVHTLKQKGFEKHRIVIE